MMDDQQPRRIYLDKLATNVHVPNHALFTDHNETHVFPDLNHTGIPTQFGKFKPAACMPNGRIPSITRSKVFRKNKLIERERLQLESTEKLFVVSHKQFMNNVLIDLERVKTAKDNRRNDLWETSIKQFNTDSAMIAYDEENPVQLKFPSPSPQSRYSSTRSMQQPRGFENSQKSMVSITSAASGNNNNSSASSLLNKKKRACNREDLYSCLLDSVDPPKTPKEWFGTIPREYESGSNANNVDSMALSASRSGDAFDEVFEDSNLNMYMTQDGSLTIPMQAIPSPQPSPPGMKKVTLAARNKWEAESIFKALNGSEDRVNKIHNDGANSTSASPTRQLGAMSSTKSLSSPSSDAMMMSTKSLSKQSSPMRT
jgi:hypothetical protein